MQHCCSPNGRELSHSAHLLSAKGEKDDSQTAPHGAQNIERDPTAVKTDSRRRRVLSHRTEVHCGHNRENHSTEKCSFIHSVSVNRPSVAVDEHQHRRCIAPDGMSSRKNSLSKGKRRRRTKTTSFATQRRHRRKQHIRAAVCCTALLQRERTTKEKRRLSKES